MITAAITAAITFVLRYFGITLSAYQIGAVAIGVKITIVALGVIFGGKLLRKRAAAAAELEKAKQASGASGEALSAAPASSISSPGAPPVAKP